MTKNEAFAHYKIKTEKELKQTYDTKVFQLIQANEAQIS